MNLSFSGPFLLEKLSREMERDFGISLVEQEFLGQVGKAGGEIRMVDLATHTWMSKAAVTKIVDRLEEWGLVSREPSATDRRVINVSLTKEGAELLGRTWKTLHHFVKTQFADRLDSNEILTLSEILQKLLESHDMWDAMLTRLRGFKSR